jgi:hypothetical protein
MMTGLFCPATRVWATVPTTGADAIENRSREVGFKQLFLPSCKPPLSWTQFRQAVAGMIVLAA